MGRSRKAEFHAAEAVASIVVPEWKTCIKWSVRQVNLKAICLERQGHQGTKTEGMKLTQEVLRESL